MLIFAFRLAAGALISAAQLYVQVAALKARVETLEAKANATGIETAEV